MTEDGGGQQPPADEDFPRGFGRSSWWPSVAAVGAAGLYLGVALFLLGHGDSSLVSGLVGRAVFVAGFTLFSVGLFGWLYHAFVSGFWNRNTGKRDSNVFRLGMLLFLFTETVTFGAGFVYYFGIRVGGWSPMKPAALLSSVVVANTVVLVTSSFTLRSAEVALRTGKRRRFLRSLAATLVLGVVFLVGQSYEYDSFITHEGFTLTSGVFASAFFGLTALHGLHVTLGTILLAIVLARGLSGQYSADQRTSVTTVSMYWHFVDVVWLLLVAVIYVGGSA